MYVCVLCALLTTIVTIMMIDNDLYLQCWQERYYNDDDIEDDNDCDDNCRVNNHNNTVLVNDSSAIRLWTVDQEVVSSNSIQINFCRALALRLYSARSENEYRLSVAGVLHIEQILKIRVNVLLLSTVVNDSTGGSVEKRQTIHKQYTHTASHMSTHMHTSHQRWVYWLE